MEPDCRRWSPVARARSLARQTTAEISSKPSNVAGGWVRYFSTPSGRGSPPLMHQYQCPSAVPRPSGRGYPRTYDRYRRPSPSSFPAGFHRRGVKTGRRRKLGTAARPPARTFHHSGSDRGLHRSTPPPPARGTTWRHGGTTASK